MRELFTIFGNPVEHSKSPNMHNTAFAGLGYDGSYDKTLLEDGSKLRDRFIQLGLKGANITVPHKEYAYTACDEVDSFANRVKAVNTIVDIDGKLYGYNTDAPGFLRAISEFDDAKSVLFLGAGGTAQSTAAILKDSGYDVTILNRSPQRLEKFAKDGFKTYTYDNFEPKDYDLIINMTSAGLNDDSLPAPKELLEKLLPKAKACIDVIYGKQTPFLKLAQSYNLPTKDGTDMLIYQGAIAFEYFTDNKFDFEQIEPYMRQSFDFN